MSSAIDKRILILAGPNGAGKTTFAAEFLPNEARCPAFVNADLIAAGLSPFEPDAVAIAAGRLMLKEIERHVRAGGSFAFETTLSGRRYSARIPGWQRAGYRVKLFFLSLASPELAIARVQQRVQAGGHGVADEVVRRRYAAGLRNFFAIYRPIVDEWALYDNSGAVPKLTDEGGN
jgi:predicted ABC-type ATPase